MYAKELDLALRLARRAGSVAMPYFRRRVRVRMKANSSPVTAADRRLERLLVDGILEVFPSDRIIGEEHGFRHGRAGRYWVIDPIDGTSSFSSRRPGFAVVIGLVDRGRPVLGVVHAPALRRTYYAVRHHGAYLLSGRRRKKLKVSTRAAHLQEAVLGGPYHPSKGSAVSKKIRSILLVQRRIPIGCAGLEMSAVAEGRLDCSLLTAVHLGIWDVAAGHVIVEEAGGAVSDVHGRPFSFRWGTTSVHRGILAANRRLHADAVANARRLGVVTIMDDAYDEMMRRLAKD